MTINCSLCLEYIEGRCSGLSDFVCGGFSLPRMGGGSTDPVTGDCYDNKKTPKSAAQNERAGGYPFPPGAGCAQQPYAGPDVRPVLNRGRPAAAADGPPRSTAPAAHF